MIIKSLPFNFLYSSGLKNDFLFLSIYSSLLITTLAAIFTILGISVFDNKSLIKNENNISIYNIEDNSDESNNTIIYNQEETNIIENETDDEENVYVQIIPRSIFLRSSPRAGDDNKIGRVYQDEMYLLIQTVDSEIKEDRKWYQILVDGETAYIRSDLGKVVVQ